jgi:bacillithiol biosynthesis cysteine-adding enzyme BshC
MLKKLIPFRKTGQLNDLVLDYLDQKEELKPFYNRFPNVKSFKDQIKEKSNQTIDRQSLVDVLKEQYSDLNASKSTQKNIQSLLQNNTYTITTGHQLNLATGPLHFIYKILSTINLTESLSKAYPDHNFVPVYWMATEDHDFAEINHFYFNSHKFFWDHSAQGKTGAITTEGLEKVWTQLNEFSNGAWHINELVELFKQAYSKPNLSEATRFLANELFGKYGLVVLDADDQRLKRSFIDVMKSDLFENTSSDIIEKSVEELKQLGYNIQVNPREINLFYLTEGSRERIVRDGDEWKVLNSHVHWKRNSLEKELKEHPERFSPNVTLRPIYQEVILPNLAYLGGGAEVSYWLELKALFDSLSIPFPMIMLRNMVLVLNDQAQKKIEQLGVEPENVFLPKHDLTRSLVKETAECDISIDKEINQLSILNEELKKKITQVDASLVPAAEAELTRRIKGLKRLEKKMIRVEKRKQKETVQRIEDLYSAVYPVGKVQERFENYSTMYAHWGRSFIDDVKANLDPLDFQMVLLGR